MNQPMHQPTPDRLKEALQLLMTNGRVIQYGVYAPYDIRAKYGATPLPDGIAIVIPFAEETDPHSASTAGEPVSSPAHHS